MMDLKNIEQSIIDKELQKIFKRNDPFILNGHMGAVIYLMMKPDKNSLVRAKAYLNKITKNINNDSRLEIGHGLCGISLGCMFMIKNGFAAKEVSHLPISIESYIYRSVCYKMSMGYDNNVVDTLLDVALYTVYRINKSVMSTYQRGIQIRLLMDMIDYIHLGEGFAHRLEPMPASLNFYLFRLLLVLSGAVSLPECKPRIIHIIQELELPIVSSFPYSEYNRLLLLCGLRQLHKEISLSSRYNEHITLLEQNTSIKRIIQEEFLSNNLSFVNGLVGLYLICSLFNDFTSCDESLFSKKILSSDIYSEQNYSVISTKQFGGLNGILGLDLMISTLIQRNQYA
ncbi:MAG: hypothetical protein IJJ94_07890 [Bacteroidaceae bacterium]|nr:hypothetical protein [Bacteroidaceae bacterium]